VKKRGREELKGWKSFSNPCGEEKSAKAGLLIEKRREKRELVRLLEKNHITGKDGVNRHCAGSWTATLRGG